MNDDVRRAMERVRAAGLDALNTAKAERDQLKAQLEANKKLLSEVVAANPGHLTWVQAIEERDALRAKLERCREALQRALDDHTCYAKSHARDALAALRDDPRLAVTEGGTLRYD